MDSFEQKCSCSTADFIFARLQRIKKSNTAELSIHTVCMRDYFFLTQACFTGLFRAAPSVLFAARADLCSRNEMALLVFAYLEVAIVESLDLQRLQKYRGCLLRFGCFIVFGCWQFVAIQRWQVETLVNREVGVVETLCLLRLCYVVTLQFREVVALQTLKYRPREFRG